MSNHIKQILSPGSWIEIEENGTNERSHLQQFSYRIHPNPSRRGTRAAKSLEARAYKVGFFGFVGL